MRRCHKPGSKDREAAQLDLTAPKSYESLLNFGGKDLYNLVRERDRSLVGETPRKEQALCPVNGRKRTCRRSTRRGRPATPHHLDGRLRTSAGALRRYTGKGAVEQFREKLSPMLQTGP